MMRLNRWQMTSPAAALGRAFCTGLVSVQLWADLERDRYVDTLDSCILRMELC
jgi:hypothetical protein